MRKGSIMSVSSPRLVSMAIGEKVDLEQLGGWRGVRALARQLSIEQVAPRLRMPLIIVSRENRLLDGRPDEYGRRLESILASVPAGGRHVLVPSFRPEEVTVADVARMRAEYWLKLGQAIRETWPAP